MEIGSCRAVAPPIANGHLHAADAVLLGRVVIVVVGIAGLDGRFVMRVVHGVFVSGLALGGGTFSAAIEAFAAFPGFLPSEIRQHLGIRPAGCARGRPAIVIGPVPADIGHGIDRGRAADDLAAHAFNATVAGAWIGLCVITPVVASIQKDLAPCKRHMNEWIAIPAAGLQQEDAAVIVLADAICERAAGGTGTDDDVIVLGLAHSAL